MLSYFPCLHQEDQLCDDEFGCSQKPTGSTGISISGYNIWGEGDLFKAPEPVMVIEETVIGIDPVTAAVSMISCGEDVIPPQSLIVSDIESSIKSGQILSEMFYECRKDLLAKEGNETPLSEVLNIKLPDDEQNSINGDKVDAEGCSSFLKSVSSSCLHSMDNANNGSSMRPSFLDFPMTDLEAACGMRRAFSEGDIKTLLGSNNSNTNSLNFQLGQGPSHTPGTTTITSQERREKLSRYRIKKSKRNFGRKIKYACRKAIADSQPRIRGRFAKTEEMGSLTKQ